MNQIITTPWLVTGVAMTCLLGAGCGEGAGATEAAFAADYQTTWLQTLACTPNSAHSGATIQIYLNDVAQEVWEDWAERLRAGGVAAGNPVEFTEGSVLVKAQYNDPNCTDLEQWTMMTKLASGADSTQGDWRWELVAPTANGGPGRALAGNSTCFGCHTPYQNQDFVGSSPTAP